MRHVRMPDLNIITAERVGWGSRVDLAKSFPPKTILASRDPVAPDYMAAREVLLPGTPPQVMSNQGYSYYELNNPDIKDGPLRKFLDETEKTGDWNSFGRKISINFQLVWMMQFHCMLRIFNYVVERMAKKI